MSCWAEMIGAVFAASFFALFVYEGFINTDRYMQNRRKKNDQG